MQHDYLKRIVSHYEAAVAIQNMLPAEKSPRGQQYPPSIVPTIELSQTQNFKLAPNFTSRMPLLPTG
jgi:hypothetical protein